ncbi:Imm25 family immunity protein [Bremerella sp.]|uniref:Imm25 family immunity protein n=1 Tax=Bremerella sp. TaxID=2795602 RepID=UPI00391DCD2E
MSFTQDILKKFKPLIDDHGFVNAKGVTGRHFVSLLRYESPEVYLVLHIKDGRDSGADTTVALWITPACTPDDSVDCYHIGYRIEINATYDPDDTYYKGCLQRIINLLPHVSALMPPIQDELKSPTIKSRRWEVYQHEREILASILKLADSDVPTAKAILQNAMKHGKGALSLKSFREECEAMAEELLSNDTLSKAALELYDNDADSISGGIYSALYAWGLGELSRRKLHRFS